MAIIEITEKNFEEVLKSGETLLIDFWASWCAPCRMLSPIVDEVAEELEGVKVAKVNIEEEPELTARYRVMMVPTLVVLKNGEEVVRSTGVVSKEEIKELVGIHA